jgi:Na+/H+ antiporter NhaD/arsenite permease-like protein
MAKKTPDLARFVSWLNHGVILMVFSMSVVVGKIADSGMFEYVIFRVIVLSNCSKLLIMICLLTGFGSIFLDNVTCILLLSPITFKLSNATGMDAYPWLMAQIMMANIGGMALKPGSFPNIIVGLAYDKLFPGDFDEQLQGYDIILKQKKDFVVNDWTQQLKVG